ncbi:MAG: heme exporter protein CcmB [Acidobacteria bacterium]|nr:heme exporter protein CcmB [Acidobacteriota bacterium]
MSSWGASFAILKKDLQSELRTKEVFNSALVFALLVIVTFSLAFEPSTEQAKQLSGGLLWIAFAFSAMLALSRTFAREVPNDCLLGLQMAPISAADIYIGKLFSNLIFLGLLELVLLPLFAIFYNVRLWGPGVALRWPMDLPGLDPFEIRLGVGPALLLIVGLGTWGLAAVGTSFAAIATSVRLREMMLPVLLFPIELPLLLALMEATTAVVRGGDFPVDPSTWLKICLGFDVVFTVLSLFLFEHILGD